MVQIFVKVDGARTSTMEMSLSDKVNDIVGRIPSGACCNKCDVYVTCDGKALTRNGELRSCGVSDGCTVQVVNRMRGGGKHRNKKDKAEKKTTVSTKGQEPERGQKEHNEEKIIQNLLSCEDAENEVIRRFVENEETRKIIERLAKANNSDMERWIQIYTEVTGLDDEQKWRCVKKSGRSRRRKGMRKMTTSGFQWCVTWRQVAHTSKPLTKQTRLRTS